MSNIDSTPRESFKSGIFNALASFATMVLVIAVVGLLMPPDESQDHLTFFGVDGIRYTALLQMGLCCLFIGAMRVVFMSTLLFKNMLLLWRLALYILSAVSVGVCCIIVFGWFPVNELGGWLGYFTGIVVTGGIAFLFIWLKTRRETKRYDNLLEEYKKQKRKP